MKTKPYTLILCTALLALAAGCSQYKVYSVKDKPNLPVGGGVIYALPKTNLCIEVTVQRRDLAGAPYSAYASELLGIAENDIDTSFRLVGIDVGTVNVADPDNYYYVQVNRGSVTVDERHLLLAIGMEKGDIKTENGERRAENGEWKDRGVRAEYNLYDRTDTLYTRYDPPERPSKLSTRKDVRSVKQRAEAAAERLEEIQTKQQELLNGEYEGSYGAEAVSYLYTQLQRQEEAVLSQFCGNVKSETVRFYLEPQMRRNETFYDTVVWFSPAEGFIGDEEHLPSDAFPIVCSIHNNGDMKVANRFVRYHTSGITPNGSSGRTGSSAAKSRSRKGFRYRIPQSAEVCVTTPVYSVKRQLALSQLGPIVELPRHRIKARFDANTLDLRELIRK